MKNREVISKRFENFAEQECSGSCKLYEYLSREIALDDDMLDLAANAAENQPIPNLFLGAVHYLLLKGTDHGAKHFYGSIVDFPRDEAECFPYFKDFCQQNEDEIISILKNKLMQTNEVRRCGYLYPVFCYIYQQVKKPLALIEIGTSSGLQLCWDMYGYDYGDGEMWGNPGSTVIIESVIKGEQHPYLLRQSPQVTSRTGFDLHVNDLHNQEDFLWLKSLIWPNHHERRELFEKAAELTRLQDLHVVEGDGVSLLGDTVNAVSGDEMICVFHTHVANQFPPEAKAKLLADISEIGQKRDICHIYNNIQDRMLHLDCYIHGTEFRSIVGETDGHGRWFSWQLA